MNYGQITIETIYKNYIYWPQDYKSSGAEIGIRLTILRIEKGFTSYEHFAMEHDFSRMHYWKIEKGKANITLKTLSFLLSLHHCSIEDFFALKPEISEETLAKLKVKKRKKKRF